MHESQKSRYRLPAWIGLLCFCLWGGCVIHIDGASNRVSHQRQVYRAHAVDTAQRLTVHTPDGHITVTGKEVSEVTLSATITAWAEDKESAHTAAQDITVTLERKDADLEARVTFPSHWHNRSARIDMILVVPRKLALNLDTGDGRIQVSAMQDAVNARTGDGNITAKAIGGELILNSGDGTLDIASVAAPRVHARTSDGRITLRDVQASDLNLHSGDGRINAEHVTSEQIHVYTSDGAIAFHCAPDMPSAVQATLETGDGSIAFSALPALSAQVEARTGDGSITVDLPITLKGKLDRSIQGTIGAGEGKVTLRTGDGSIHIRQAK